MKKSTTDPARAVEIFSRIGMYNDKIFEFIKPDETAYDYSVVSSFEIGIKVKKNDVNDFLTLTEGDGLTRFNTNKLLYEITEAQAAKFKERTYYLELRRTIDGKEKIWISSNNIWHLGVFNGVSNEETLIINEESEVIQLIIDGDLSYILDIDGGSSASVYQIDQLVDQGGA